MIKKSITWGISLAVLVGLSACGGGGSSSEEPKGYFIDAPVEGLGYVCGDRSGITDAKGAFFCDEAPVVFKIGEMSVGTLSAFTSDSKVYPQDILGLDRSNFSDDSLLKLIRLLQSLDDDGDISKSITLSQDLIKAYGADQDFIKTPVEVLATPLYGDLVSQEDALKHLQESMGVATTSTEASEDEALEQDMNVDGMIDDSIQENTQTSEHNETNDTTLDEYSDVGDIGQGFYVDAAIEGVEYSCGNQEGLTDANGTFTFEEGEECLFTLGGIPLREVDAKELTDQVTIFEDDLETAQFLQSLDQDNNADNGIEIGTEVLEHIKESNLTAIPVGEEELRSLLSELGDVEGFEGALVSLDEVQEHLASTKAELERLGAIVDTAEVTEDEIDEFTSELESQLDAL